MMPMGLSSESTWFRNAAKILSCFFIGFWSFRRNTPQFVCHFGYVAIHVTKKEKERLIDARYRSAARDRRRSRRAAARAPLVSAEAPTFARLHREFLPAHKLIPNGHHHEIYLTDPNRVAPEKLKTVLRQPVRSSG